MKKFDLLLLLPPLANPYYSDPFLPYLTSFLKRNDLKVAQKDINIEILDILLSKNYLLTVQHCLQRYTDYYSKKEHLTSIDKKHYEALIAGLLCITYAIDNIDNARRASRNKKYFYNIDNLTEADRIFFCAFKSISALYYPTKILPESLEMQYDFTDTKDIKEAIYDEKSNIFLDIFRKYIIADIIKLKIKIYGIAVSDRRQIISTFTLARLLKEASPTINIFIFGDFFSNIPNKTLAHAELFDFVNGFILNTPEKSLLKISKNILSNEVFWKQVPNLVYRAATDDVKLTNSEAGHTLAHLKLPDYAGVNLKRYFSPEIIIPLLTARKNFINIHASNESRLSEGVSFKYHFSEATAQQIVDDMAYLNNNYGASRFLLTGCHNSVIFLDSLSRLILKKNISVKWGCKIAVEHHSSNYLSKKRLKVFYDAGCRKIWLDLDPFSKALNCPIRQKFKEISRLLRCLNEISIAVHLDIRLGYPMDKKDDLLKIISLVIQRKKLFEMLGSTICIEQFNLMSYMLSLKKIKSIPSVELYHNVSSPLDATTEFYCSGSLSNNQITVFEEYLTRICEVALKKNPFLNGFEAFAFLYLLNSIDLIGHTKLHINPGNLPLEGKDFFSLVPKLHKDVNIGHFRSDAIEMGLSLPHKKTFLCYHPLEDKVTVITPYQDLFLGKYFSKGESFQQIFRRYCFEQKNKIDKNDVLRFLKTLLQKNILVV